MAFRKWKINGFFILLFISLQYVGTIFSPILPYILKCNVNVLLRNK